MKASKLCAVGLPLFWIAGVLVAAAPGQTAQKSSGEKGKTSLIRMDLLQAQRNEVGLPKRNIFSPWTSSSFQVQAASEASQVPQPSLEEGQDAAQGQETQPPATINVNLRYIGFIEYTKSAKKITALIILEGQPMAVAEGEVVSEGIKIGKITPRELEIILPDSTTRKFSLEGE